MKIRHQIPIILLGFFAVRLMAQEETASSRIFSFHVENDVFAKTDYHYTSGLKLNWLFMEIPENKEKNLLSKIVPFEFDLIPHVGAALGNLITYNHIGS